MAVVIEHSSNAVHFQSTTTRTVSVDMGTNPDRDLLVYASCPNGSGRVITGVTYNGVSLTTLEATYTLTSFDMYSFKLENTDSGTNDLVVTFDASPGANFDLMIVGFSGSELGNSELVNTLTTDPSDTITVAENALIWNQSWSTLHGFGSEFIKVDGVDSTEELALVGGATYEQVGYVSAALTSGSKSVTTDFTNQATLHSIEIKEAGGAPATGEGNFSIFF